jgi:5-methylcytosine-specific restriction protein A
MWSRESRQARGYGAAWDRLRKQVLTREPLCRMCHVKGRVTAATEVDHIKPKAKGGTDELSNLQPACQPCHKAKSAAEMGRTPRVRYGPDGYPL